MKRWISLLTIFCCIIALAAPTALANSLESTPSIVGKACILMDVKTKEILYELASHELMEPASTTKIMTCILALEKGDLNDKVVISNNPPLVGGSSIYLKSGDSLTLEEILYGMMLNSGNDAATAVAEHIGGSTPEFVEMMNKKAKEIGAKDTKYANPSGLPDEGHVTTAYDLALISRYALLNFPDFQKIVSSKTMKIPGSSENTHRLLENTNKLLWDYEGADGLKTGYTSTAGRTLVATATRDGWQLMAVILNSGWDEVFDDAATLLDYGFDNFQRLDLIQRGETISKAKVRFGHDVELVTAKGISTIVPKNVPITRAISIEDDIMAPIEKGSVLGKLEFYLGNKKLNSVDLIAQSDVKRKVYTYWWFWLCVITLLLCFLKLIRLWFFRHRQ